jgi:Phasin protein
MAEAKKASSRSAKGAKGAKSSVGTHKADLVEMAAATVADTVDSIADAKPALQAAALQSPFNGGALFSNVREQGDALRQAVREVVSVSAQGALEVNEKIIDALQSQSHVALDLWRTAITTADLPQVLRTQTSATRQAYETASAQWRDIAGTTARWMTRSFEPLQSALHRPGH